MSSDVTRFVESSNCLTLGNSRMEFPPIDIFPTPGSPVTTLCVCRVMGYMFEPKKEMTGLIRARNKNSPEKKSMFGADP